MGHHPISPSTVLLYWTTFCCTSVYCTLGKHSWQQQYIPQYRVTLLVQESWTKHIYSAVLSGTKSIGHHSWSLSAALWSLYSDGHIWWKTVLFTGSSVRCTCNAVCTVYLQCKLLSMQGVAILGFLCIIYWKMFLAISRPSMLIPTQFF